MNIETLKQNRRNRNEESTHIYLNILDKIWKKIQHYDKNDETNYLYELPNFILGEPQYDKHIAKSLIIRKMKKGNFDIRIYEFGEITYILIDWTKITDSHTYNTTPSPRLGGNSSKSRTRKGNSSSSDVYKVTFSK